MTIKIITSMDDFCTNAYAVVSQDKRAVLIDAPGDFDSIADKTVNCGIEIEAVLLTHGHIDHIASIGRLKAETGCRVLISEKDKFMLTDSRACLADYFSALFEPFTRAETFSDGDTLSITGMEFKVIETPGHTPGSVCFVCEDVIFSGDTLFKCSIGRDFGWKEYAGIIDSIDKLYQQGKNYTVYPGHGGKTDLYDELICNPYLGRLQKKYSN